jgi:diacylglycerol kinase (ATP)
VSNQSPRKKRRLWHSFADAFRGIGAGIRTERNMRIHVTACVFVLYFAAQLSLSRGEMACLLLAIGMVMAAELLNTAVEKLCDFNQKNRNRYIRVIKDMAAGGVLVAAVAALLVGVVILFRPELWRLLWDIVTSPIRLGLLCLAVAVAGGFVFLGPAWVWESLDRFHHGK